MWQGDKKAIAHVFTYRKHPWLESMNSVNQSLVYKLPGANKCLTIGCTAALKIDAMAH